MACGGAGQARPAQPLDCGSPASLLGEARAYLVVFRPAAQWSKDNPMPEQREHSQYLLSLYRAGTLKFAGRFADASGGAMFFVAPDDAAALAIVQADPAVVNAAFDFVLRPWKLADWKERAQTWPK
jgi:uncharacterized protein